MADLIRSSNENISKQLKDIDGQCSKFSKIAEKAEDKGNGNMAFVPEAEEMLEELMRMTKGK